MLQPMRMSFTLNTKLDMKITCVRGWCLIVPCVRV